MIRRPTNFEEQWLATTLRRSGAHDEHGDYDYHQFMLDVVDVLRAWVFAIGVILLLLVLL